MNKRDVSRRLLVQRAVTMAAGAITMVGITADRAAGQSKSLQAAVAYQDE